MSKVIKLKMMLEGKKQSDMGVNGGGGATLGGWSGEASWKRWLLR